MITEQPALFWGIIVSMWIGNFFLIVLNLPLIGLWVHLIMVPYHYLYPVILVFCGIGVFSLNNSDFDIHLMALFGFLGYMFAKLDCEPAPMLLGFILGPMMEEYLRRALIIAHGDPDGVRHQPDQRHDAGPRGRHDGLRADAGDPQEARRGVRGRIVIDARGMPQARGHRSCASLVARFAEPDCGAGVGEGDAHLNDREHR